MLLQGLLLGLTDGRIQVPIHSTDLLHNLINFRFHPVHLIILIIIILLLLFPSSVHGLKFKQMVAQLLECSSNTLVSNSPVRLNQVSDDAFRVDQEDFDLS